MAGTTLKIAFLLAGKEEMEVNNYFLEKDLLRFKSPPPWKPDGVKTLELLIQETTGLLCMS